MRSIQEKPAALIFDMDGTLLDTEPLYTIASQKVLDPFGVEFTMELKRRSIGGDSRRSAQILIDHYDLPMTADEYLNEREVFLRELFIKVAEMPHAGEFITDVNSTSILMGLATSSHKHLYELKFSAKPWGGLFHEVVCGDDPELKRGKPDPDIFLLCADRLSVAPERCIVFEDSPNGIKAARAAGMQVIAINSPYVEKSDLSEAALIIDSFREMQSLMQSWAD